MSKSLDDITISLSDALSTAKVKAYLGTEIPNDLQLEINKLMCDYNEAIKVEQSKIIHV